jgi:hypothetical protein
LSHLRFTPDEYRTIADLCRRHGLGHRSQPVFNRLLGALLCGRHPELADRLCRLRRGQLDLLYWHFRERTSPPWNAYPQEFSGDELRLLAEACAAAPFRVRFVRPFKSVLVELFQEEWPELARKLSALSGHKFERLYEQLCERRREGA